MKKQDATALAGLQKQCETVSSLLKILAHPHRLLILCSLSEGEMTVSDLERASGASQSAVSQFLKGMRLEGLIVSRRVGRHVFYRIADARVVKLVKALSRIFCG